MSGPPPSTSTLLHPRIRKWIKGKFGRLTSAQEETIPHILAGHSVLLSSPTGSGKTLAGFLGVIDHLVRSHESGGLPPGITALYVSPLRALAYDMQKNLQAPLGELGFDFIRVGLRTGDTSLKERAAQKRKPPHIWITTPESLGLVLSQPAYRAALAHTRFLIVDELHALAENKRGAHLMLSAERMEEGRGATDLLIRIGLSATVAPLDVMAGFLTGSRPCEIVDVSEKRRSIIEVFSPIRKNPYPASGYTASRVLGELATVIRSKKTTLIFTNTRSGAETIGHRLKQEMKDLAEKIEVHHASLDRGIRLEVEDRLKKGELRAVVCSTSLELGIDIGSIDLVIMVSAPKGVARALQRMGRSGHSIHETSHGLLLATNINDLVECAATAWLMEHRELEQLRILRHPLDVLAQHLVGIAIEADTTADEAFTLVRRAYPYRDLSREEFDRVVRYLEGGGESLEGQYKSQFGKIEIRDGLLMVTAPRVARDYYQNAGTIASDSMVQVRLGRKRLGSVEESFIKRLNVGDVFILNGRAVRLVETRLLDAKVTPARGELPTVPRWNANKMPLASGVAAEVEKMRTHLAKLLESTPPALAAASDWLVEKYDITASNAEAILRQFRSQAAVSLIPNDSRFLIEVYREENRIHYFFHSLIGRSANDALSRIVAWRIQRRKGGNALVTVDDYGFLLTLRDFQVVTESEWKMLFSPANAAADLRDALRKAQLVKWQFRGVAQTGLMVSRNDWSGERKPRALQWSAEVLFEVLQQHEPNHPLLEQAYREATHTFLDLPGAEKFLGRAAGLEWIEREVTRVSPFAFGVFASKIKEGMMLEDPEAAIERLYHQMYKGLEEETGIA